MSATFSLAFFAGLLTILSPCALTTLPAILSGSVTGRSNIRPFAIILGKVLSFTLLGALFASAASALGLSSSSWRLLGAAFILFFGLMILFPKISVAFFARLGRAGTGAARWSDNFSQAKKNVWREFGGGLFLGASLGAVWSPCSGAVLGAILTLLAAKGISTYGGSMLFVYALGAGLPMLILAYGGTRLAAHFKKISGVAERVKHYSGAALVLTAFFVAAGLDRKLQALLLPYFPLVNF